MNDAGNAKQQIVERIKNSTNILVTVSTDPSVDELSAALGLTILLNKLNKHATAVVSGDIPAAITFLDPAKTFENTVDSLRDFIIALDKEKADHLRYKVEGDVVKIFITPYRTTISSDDLDFSQGDYNVELVIALGVKNKDHLDTALAAHGRILHDAAVATLTAGAETSELGSLDWHDDNASSLSEMLVGLSEALKTDKPVLDEQIATAFLTGIVAATDRFSNNRTSSRVMTMAAQLMAAGANQQLIAAKLQEGHEIGPDAVAGHTDGTTDLAEGESTKLDKPVEQADKSTEEPKKNNGELDISHEIQGDVEAVGQAVAEKNQEQAAQAAEEQLAEQLATTTQPVDNVPSVADLQKDIAAASAEVVASAQPLQGAVPPEHWRTPEPSSEPQLGGTLNATTEQAADDRRREEADDRNKTILSHGDYLGDSQPIYDSPINATIGATEEEPVIDPFAAAPASYEAKSTPQFSPVPDVQSAPPTVNGPTLADIDAQNRTPSVPSADDARMAIEAALATTPTEPVVAPLPTFDAQPQPAPYTPEMPPMPDFSTLPPPVAPVPPSFDMPNQANGTPPDDRLGDIFAPDANPPSPDQPKPADPGQFHIPGQQ
jgi:hypothetical protein